MKKKILLFFIAFFTIAANAQENINSSQKKEIVSPEINQDHSVTFRLFAPQAKKVQVQSDFLPAQNNQQGIADLTKDSNGVWTFTSDKLKSELYSYTFIVDGLKTHDPNNVYLIRDVSSVVNIFLIDDGLADLYKVNDVPHGTVSKRWYQSNGLKMTRRITVYTPAGYENSTEKYPVLYLLHGLGGDEEAWMSLGCASQILDNLIAQKKAKPMLVVMPNGNTSNSAAPGESSKGFYKPVMRTPDIFDGEMVKNFGEVIEFVEDNYRVKKDKANRAIAGLSMGGFHSLWTAANFPNTFDYVGLFSPVIMPPDDATTPVYKNLDNKLQIQKKNDYKLYWIAIGDTDFLYKSATNFRDKIDKMDFKYTYKESKGGHTWSNWRAYLSEFVPLLFK